MYFRRAAILYVLFTPLAAMLSAFEKLSIGGFNYTGFMWSSMFVAGVWLLAMLWLDPENAARQTSFYRWWPWVVWFGFVWLSLLWCGEIKINSNVQDAMQLSMPLLVGLVAESAIRNRQDLQMLLRMFGVTVVGMALFAMADSSGTFERLGIATQTRAVALAATLVGGVLLAGFPQSKVWPLLGWGLALSVTLITKSRMATGALVLAPVLHMGYRSLGWNFLGLAATAVLGLAIFQTETFQERFFYSGSGTVEDLAAGDIDDAGRFPAWEQIWNKSQQSALVGYGAGTTVDYVPTIWTDMHHIHNDYLRILFEQGWIGLSLYLSAAVIQFVVLWKFLKTADGVLRTAFLAAWLGLWMMLITSCTDNTIVYNLFYTDPLFAVLGAAYGVFCTERQQSTLLAVGATRTYAPATSPFKLTRKLDAQHT